MNETIDKMTNIAVDVSEHVLNKLLQKLYYRFKNINKADIEQPIDNSIYNIPKENKKTLEIILVDENIYNNLNNV